MATADPNATARRLIDANMYMTLATADAEGHPWASPVWFASPTDDGFLWVSDPAARHSRNIAARREVAIVIFDSTAPIGAAEALYVDAVAEEVPTEALADAIASYSHRSEECGARAWKVDDVTEPARFRLYRALASARFVLGPHDERLPVTTS